MSMSVSDRIDMAADNIDSRYHPAAALRRQLNKVFPTHWSFLLGEIALYSFIILLLTGVYLTLFFDPSMAEVTYNGVYQPLRGIQMSKAYETALNISFEVRGGLFVRQVHHWAALLFAASIMVHMARVFFTGAFRKPREINWVIGSVLALLAIVEGFSGYSLPDDLLSGTGIRAMQGFVQTAPVIGSYLVYGIFGGPFPGEAIIPRLYSAHILLLPALLIGLFTAHIVLVALQKHTQFPGPGRTNDNVVGFPVMPVYAAKAGGFFFIVFGVISLMAALVTINAVWAYGPYDPSPVTAGSQPDWYMGFADGALRLLPGWLEFTLAGFTFSMNIMPGALILLPLVYIVVGVYPFVERWVTGDNREHHLLDRPRNAPTRTAIGMAGISMYSVLMFAAANDIIAIKLHMSINDITHVLRAAFFILPIIVFWCTKRICLSLQRADRNLVLHQRESGTIIRTPDGAFFERHDELTADERWILVQHEPVAPIEITDGVDENGVAKPASRGDKLRAKLSHFYFKDAVNPVTPAELAAAHHDGHGHEAIEAADEDDSALLGSAVPSRDH